MSEKSRPHPRNNEFRSAMRRGARDWIANANAPDIALKDITEEDHQKLERYSAATAAIALIARQAVHGQGLEARFRRSPPAPESSKYPLLAFQQELEELFYQASFDLPPKEALQVQQ